MLRGAIVAGATEEVDSWVGEVDEGTLWPGPFWKCCRGEQRRGVFEVHTCNFLLRSSINNLGINFPRCTHSSGHGQEVHEIYSRES